MDMYTYSVSVDVSATWEENDIEVVGLDIEAPDAQSAYERAEKEIAEGKHSNLIGNREVYVWSVSEEDRHV